MAKRDISKFDGLWIPEPNSGCWLWVGAINGHGYALYNDKLVHRIVCEEISEEKPYALHRCDVRLCINPAHLYAGTHSDNMKDMADRGRSTRGKCRVSKPRDINITSLKNIRFDALCWLADRLAID